MISHDDFVKNLVKKIKNQGTTIKHVFYMSSYVRTYSVQRQKIQKGIYCTVGPHVNEIVNYM